MAKLTNLKNKKGTILYPTTKTQAVYTDDNVNVQVVLNNMQDRISQLEAEGKYYKGYFKNETELLIAYPNNIENPNDRKGWFAVVGNDEANATIYAFDIESNLWVNTGGGVYQGANSVNGITADATGNIHITGTDINSNVNGEDKNITQHLTEFNQRIYENTEEVASAIKSIDEINNNIDQIEPEIEALQNKPSVVYLTGAEIEELTSLSYSNNQIIMVSEDNDNYKTGEIYKYILDDSDKGFALSKLDTGGAIPLLEGTEENPIIIYDLEYDWFFLKGYYKLTSSSEKTSYILDNSKTTEVSKEAVLFFMTSNTSSKKILIYNARFFTGDTLIVDYGNFSFASLRLFSNGNTSNRFGYELRDFVTPLSFGGTYQCLTTSNTQTYTPTADYHPATKKYVDDSISDNPPINILDDIENITDGTYINEFATPNNYEDKSLYYFKKVGEKETYLQIEANTKYDKVYIDENILSVLTSNLDSIYFSCKKGNTSGGIYLYARLNKIFIGNTVFYEDGVWNTNVIDEYDYISISSSYTSNKLFPYLKYLNVEPISAPVQLALKEDLDNVSVTLPKINGTEETLASLDNVYLPTTSGISGQILASSGNGEPTWINAPEGISVYDDLDSESATTALSANQGRVLAEKIDKLSCVKLNGDLDNPIILENLSTGFYYIENGANGFTRESDKSDVTKAFTGAMLLFVEDSTSTMKITGNVEIFDNAIQSSSDDIINTILLSKSTSAISYYRQNATRSYVDTKTSTLSNDIETISTETNNLQSNITTLQNTTSNLETATNSIQNDITTLQNNNTNLSNSIDDLLLKLSDESGRIDTLSTEVQKVDTLSTKVDTLSTKVDTIDEKVDTKLSKDNAVVDSQLGIKNTEDNTIDYIKHLNNNFQITSASGQSLLNIDEQLEKVTMFNEKVLRASDFELDTDTNTLIINLD